MNFNPLKLIKLLNNIEIFGVKIGDETVFTYIIGSQVEITNDKLKMEEELNIERKCDVNDMHIWAKLALSKQEINTKHNSILNDSYINYVNIETSILNKTQIS